MAAAVDVRAQPAFDWVAIPAGRALIGAEDMPTTAVHPSERPATTVALPSFAIGRTPVTNVQYAAFVTATGHRSPAHWAGATPPPRLAGHPVTYVDWHDAEAFCAWARVRLPSEAEWEKAARGTDGRPYPWGWDRPDPRQANHGGLIGTTTAIDTMPAGVSPYGASDMAGNVWEWTASLHRPYPYRADDGREDTAAPGPRVLRGGSFMHGPDDVRCAAREAMYGDACDEYIGFRVAVDGAGTLSSPAFDWVTVPAGPFVMGSLDDPASEATVDTGVATPAGLGRPRHALHVAAFAIARTPVTNAQYAAYVHSAGARSPGHWEGGPPPLAVRDHPVTYVDWHEACAFCEWAAVRLPTEAEWEYAAAGAHGLPFPWGAVEPDDSTARYGRPSDATATGRVGERLAGASPFGVLDLAGNVWEWTSSLQRRYPYRPDDGREDAAAPGQRVLRGGSFRSPRAVYLRCAFRSRSHPTRRRDHIGFRVARGSWADGS